MGLVGEVLLDGDGDFNRPVGGALEGIVQSAVNVDGWGKVMMRMRMMLKMRMMIPRRRKTRRMRREKANHSSSKAQCPNTARRPRGRTNGKCPWRCKRPDHR